MALHLPKIYVFHHKTPTLPSLYTSYTAVSFVFSAFPVSPLMSPEPFNFDVLELSLSCVCVLPATLCRYVLTGLLLAHASGSGLRCETITCWLSVYKFLHSCLDCVVSTSGMFYLLPYSTSGIFKLFCDFVCTTYHIKLMTELVLETTVFHPYVGGTWHFTIWFTARRVLETVELYQDFMGS